MNFFCILSRNRTLFTILFCLVLITCEKKNTITANTSLNKENTLRITEKSNSEEIKQIIKLLHYEYASKNETWVSQVDDPIEFLITVERLELNDEIKKNWNFSAPNFKKIRNWQEPKPKIKFIEAVSSKHNKKIIYRVETDSFIETALK